MYNAKGIEIASKTYYWKPMAALFRSLEIKLYCDSGVEFYGPILDLGCGDGRIGQMLQQVDLIKEALYGIDYSMVELKKAKETRAHSHVLQTDANYLPFKDESFSTIICNGVLCAIQGGVGPSLQEINRVLKKNGKFVVTVPTDKFIDVIFLPKILKRISPKLNLRYTNKLNNRLTHFNVYPSEQWEIIFKVNGFNIIETKKYFSYKAGFLWNIMTLQIFKIFSVLKLVKNRKYLNFFSYLLTMVLKRIYPENISENSDFGYMFIVAKNEN